jgi:hypothetical protein
VEEERVDVVTQGMEGGLKDDVGYRLESLDPFPALVAVELLEVVEVVLHPDGLVVASQAVDDHPSLFRHPVEESRQIRQIREVRRLVDDEKGEVEPVDIERVRDRRTVGDLLAVDGHFMTERRGLLDVLGDRPRGPRVRVEL